MKNKKTVRHMEDNLNRSVVKFWIFTICIEKIHISIAKVAIDSLPDVNAVNDQLGQQKSLTWTPNQDVQVVFKKSKMEQKF